MAEHEFDFLTYANVPKDTRRNKVWRQFLIHQADVRPGIKDALWLACKDSWHFYANSFLWTYDPRKEPSCLPLITYEFQDELAEKIIENIRLSKDPENMFRRFDILIAKSRDMGATVVVMSVIDWFLRFHSEFSSRVISRKEDYVDKPGDPDTLFAKLDYIDERLPGWLLSQGRDRTRLHLYNQDTRSGIDGESSNENAGRGGRNTVVVRDEEAFAENGSAITKALNQTTRCQIRISTPNGVGNSYHQAYVNGKCDTIILHWSMHPEKARGLYSIADGVVTVLDKEWHEKHPDYEFKIEPTHADPGTDFEFLRSPWFDGECDAADSIADIAQELQCSFLGSGSPYFRADKLAFAKSVNARPPLHAGQLKNLLPSQYGLPILNINDTDGRQDKLKLWFHPDGQGLPPQMTRYVIGVDIASGNGTSDSTINIADSVSGSKVAEYRSNGISPDDLGYVALALCEWFTTEESKPFLAWDGGGHGITFGLRIVRSGYSYVYYYRKEDDKNGKRSSAPGVPTNRQLKNALFSDYRSALFDGTYITPSAETYEQAEQFIHDGAGGVCHQRSKTTDDNSAKGEQHGDLVTGEAILYLALRDAPEPHVPERIVHPGSQEARFMEYERMLAEKEREVVWVS